MQLSLVNKVRLLVGGSFLLFLAAAGYLIKDNWQEVDRLKEGRDALAFLSKTSLAISALAVERGKSASYMQGAVDFSEIEEQRAFVDTMMDGLVKQKLSIPILISLLSEAKGKVRDQIQEARYVVENGASSKEAVGSYSVAVDDLIQFYIAAAKNTQNSTIAGFYKSLSNLEDAKNALGIFRAKLSAVVAADKSMTEIEIIEIASLEAKVKSFLSTSSLILTPEGEMKKSLFLKQKSWKDTERIFEGVVSKYQAGNFGVDPIKVFATVTKSVDYLGEIIAVEGNAAAEIVENKLLSSRITFWFFLLLVTVSLAIPWTLSKSLINTIMVPVRSAIGELNRSTDKVSIASSRLTSTSTNMSSSFQETAASLQETVSTMSEMNSMLGTTLDKTKETHSASNSVASEVYEGEATVREMVESMVQIQEANSKLDEIAKVIHAVSQKTQIINDIVFKTQLLSFNASIEAARAGQHGKGFAVVAEEVGNLAQTSGKAANEISELIEQSQQKVSAIVRNTTQRIDQGREVTRRVNNNFKHISEKISAITDQIQVITEASNEQKIGIEQITTAFSEIDSATQASLREATRSSQLASDLEVESKRLGKATVGLIRLASGSRSIERQGLAKSRDGESGLRISSSREEYSESSSFAEQESDADLIMKLAEKANRQSIAEANELASDSPNDFDADSSHFDEDLQKRAANE